MFSFFNVSFDCLFKYAATRQVNQKHLSGFLFMLLYLLPASTLLAGDIKLEQVFTDVEFERPLAFIPAPGQSNIWYVVEQAGRVIRLEQEGAKLGYSIFVDIRDQVNSLGYEDGLLGMAFDPGFEQNGRFYLSYTQGEKGKKDIISILSRFVSADGGKTVVANQEQILMQLDQPYGNHNGGGIHFGPDGYLYFGLGDGGHRLDPHGHGQNTQTLLGAMLRIDVSGDGDYTVPADNPFVKGGGKPEIYAYGLRNPWRWSFDRKTGDLWVADVGQWKWEEVNKLVPGGNYGWNIREGKHCVDAECDKEGLIDPVLEYSHGAGCSITGGYVYRGKAIPSLYGTYLYADYCEGTIWGAAIDGQEPYKPLILLRTGLNISSFGEDNDGELYVINLKGSIHKVVGDK